MNVQSRPLTIKDAQSVANLEKKLFPQNLHNGLRKIQKVFLTDAFCGSRINFGLFDDDKLVGYNLCYPKGFRKISQSRHEAILIFSDLAILPQYRNHTPEFFNKHVSAAKSAFPDRPVHMYCFPKYKEKWIQREHLFIKNGYRLLSCRKLNGTPFKEDIFLLRWGPVDVPLHANGARIRHIVGTYIAFGLSLSLTPSKFLNSKFLNPKFPKKMAKP